MTASLTSAVSVTNCGLTVVKGGATILLLSLTEHPVPAFAVGHFVQIDGSVPNAGGVVSKVFITLDITRHPGGESRNYMTTVTLT